MGRLIYSAITSLDGYIEDEAGRFDWAVPDEEVHAFVNNQERTLGTFLYGRRMYEMMVGWETMDTGPDQAPLMRDFALLWRAAEKIVYSTTLATVSSARTRIERAFDPEAVRRLKATADRDISVGGPDLAAHAFRAGLVDECRLFLNPVIVGGGKPALPRHVRLKLDLLEERRFSRGVVYLRYRANP
jgi:dihydrofolate reductase